VAILVLLESSSVNFLKRRNENIQTPKKGKIAKIIDSDSKALPQALSQLNFATTQNPGFKFVYFF